MERLKKNLSVKSLQIRKFTEQNEIYDWIPNIVWTYYTLIYIML